MKTYSIPPEKNDVQSAATHGVNSPGHVQLLTLRPCAEEAAVWLKTWVPGQQSAIGSAVDDFSCASVDCGPCTLDPFLENWKDRTGKNDITIR